MTSRLPRLRRRRAAPDVDRDRPDAEVVPVDPTRPGPLRIRDGVPIAHDGPPGFPGRAPVEDADDDEARS